MSEKMIVDMLKRQFANVHFTLHDSITKCPDDQWRCGTTKAHVPARMAFHLIQATEFHLDPAPKNFDWNAWGIDWEECEAVDLPDRETVLGYLGRIEAKVDARLDELGLEGLLGPDYAGFFPTAMDHVLYTMRHAQHHVGQIAMTLAARDVSPGKWK